MRLRKMILADLDEVMRIEQAVHAHPWTRGNFFDALTSANICKVYEDEESIAGYAVLLPVVDEVELLNISIDGKHQRKGLGAQVAGRTYEDGPRHEHAPHVAGGQNLQHSSAWFI